MDGWEHSCGQFILVPQRFATVRHVFDIALTVGPMPPLRGDERVRPVAPCSVIVRPNSAPTLPQANSVLYWICPPLPQRWPNDTPALARAAPVPQSLRAGAWGTKARTRLHAAWHSRSFSFFLSPASVPPPIWSSSRMTRSVQPSRIMTATRSRSASSISVTVQAGPDGFSAR